MPTEDAAEDGLLRLAEGFAQLVEMAAGHRQRAAAAGFSSQAAETMAVDLHAGLVQVTIAKAGAGGRRSRNR